MIFCDAESYNVTLSTRNNCDNNKMKLNYGERNFVNFPFISRRGGNVYEEAVEFIFILKYISELPHMWSSFGNTQ